ncbi:MAG: hypothetical protein IKA31_02380 [Clostridia bacterium]|nr:hypothetical protein [Clostridia bacterium]
MSDLENRINALNQERTLQNQAEQQRILAEKAAKQAERKMKSNYIKKSRTNRDFFYFNFQ